MGNLERAARLIADVRDAGVEEFCVCAGSRNAPLLAVLGTSDARLFSFVDERSAAFFAVGRMKLHGKPVAVVTTSGTAAAELLPATIESYYAGLPLVLITADRPARFRGTGAPQSIEQVGIFGVYAETELESWSGTRPLHWNVEFEEEALGAPRPTAEDADSVPRAPELDAGSSPSRHPERERGTWVGGGARTAPCAANPSVEDRPRVAELDAGASSSCHPERERGTWVGGGARTAPRAANAPRSLAHAGDLRKPVVILGAIAPQHRDRVRAFVSRLNAPTYAEPLSGLREDRSLPLITSGERMIARAQFDSVIRIGNVPTLRFWRDLEASDVPVTHFSDLNFPGLTRGAVCPIEALPELDGKRDESFFAEDRARAKRFDELLDEEPQSELAMFRALSRELPHGARVYLGNSLPIREWDLAATREDRAFAVEANRGANGIDGQLSTFFGWCDPARDNVCVVGDLTALYDLNAPWILSQLQPLRARIVVVNNGGGRIFSRVASLRELDEGLRERIIENVHDLHFSNWAAMWKLDVTELRPDAEASKRAWRKYDELWS